MPCNSTVLLTGATGLVGRFLLAGLMRRRRPTIVLVRPQARRSIAQRIDEALAPFESACHLPRPTILAGDLTAPGLGLSADDRLLLQHHRLSIVHSAASIRFQADDPVGEPYATNVRGTEHLLELARELSVEQFHHVSTAYVQCDRQRASSAYETPVSRDWPAGNDYERSKIIAEDLVRSCGWIGEKTIYRPSIVVGDSQTAYTSTYHGFYAPLQIAWHYAAHAGFDGQAGDAFRERLGLAFDDCKNLVPVDWVAAAVLDLVDNPSAHGRIFHLTHPRPARLQDIQAAIVDALQAKVARSRPPEQRSAESLDPELFRQQLAVYDSYFQSDPTFDRAGAAAFLPHLPCPEMDYQRLRQLADFALESNFGWPRPQPRQSAAQNLTLRARSSPDVRISRQAYVGETNGHNSPLTGSLIELEILGLSALGLPREPVQLFYRSSSAWKRVPVLSSVDGPNRMRVVATEQSLTACLTERIDPAQFLAEGRWSIQGPLPADWLEILRDWTQHLSVDGPVDDVERPAPAKP